MKLIGDGLRYFLCLVVWSVLFFVLAALGHYYLWPSVAGWMQPAPAPHTVPTILRQPLWTSCWFAIASWWVISYAFVMRKVFGGGGWKYVTSSFRGWVGGQYAELTRREPVFYTPFDKQSAKGRFTTAFWFSLTLAILYACAAVTFDNAQRKFTFGVLVPMPVQLGLFALLAACLILFYAAKTSNTTAPVLNILKKISVAWIVVICVHAAVWAVIFALCQANVLQHPKSPPNAVSPAGQMSTLPAH